MIVVASRGVAAQPASPAAASLAVYLDCRTHCDTDFIRTEITFVDWVRDRADADVHLLVTSQSAGAGGQSYTLAFLGSQAFAGRGDTLTFVSLPTSTSDERRQRLTQVMALGLVQFAIRTPAITTLRVTRSASTPGAVRAAATRDPWHAWVFELSLNGSMSGERAYSSRYINTEVEAGRVTEAWKTEVDIEYSYRNDRTTLQEFDSTGTLISEETFRNLQRDGNVEVLQVKSISDHFSLGGYAEVASQTFRNQKLRVVGLGAVEYNLFPYAVSTRRELTFRYGIGFSSFRYADTTLFDKLRETLPTQIVEATYNTRQPWGSANVNVEHSAYLHDVSKRATEVNADLGVRVFRGFSVNIGGRYNWIHDQVYLPREEGTTADVLLRRRALLTGYQYHVYAGVSYTFGSIFNNVVNPRF